MNPTVLELAGLIAIAYAQRAGTTAPVPPSLAGLVIEDTLTVHENGVQVPFGFIASLHSKSGESCAYVVLRGTSSLIEWLDDGFVVPAALTAFGHTTTGFEALYRQLSPQIVKTLRRINAPVIYCTGHSLGGALAVLAAVDIWNNLQVKPETVTFSAPRSGDVAFAQAFQAAGLACTRIFNTEDLVPTLPPATTDLTAKLESPSDWLLALLTRSRGIFQHVGTPVALTYNLGTVEANHILANLVAQYAP